jgi:hypothetical protein
MPDTKYFDLDSCAEVQCLFSGNDGVQIAHNVLHEEGFCCQLNGKLVKNGYHSYNKLCHNGKVMTVLSDTTDDGQEQFDDKPVPPINQGQSALNDMNNGFEPMEPSSNDMADRCEPCYQDHYSQGSYKEMSHRLQRMISNEPINNVYFLLNGNNREHKFVASALATELPINDGRRGFISYYAFHDDYACAYYKWDDQCFSDKCQLATSLSMHDGIEQHQGKSRGQAFRNAADLAFYTKSEIQANDNLPLCRRMGHDNKSPGSHNSLVLFFVSTNSPKVSLPDSIKDHVNAGCRVAIITFNWKHFNEAKKFASLDMSGQLLAFNLEVESLQDFSLCQLNCQCNIKLENLAVEPKETRHSMLVKPAYINTCGVSMFKRADIRDPIEEKEYNCEEFQSMGMINDQAAQSPPAADLVKANGILEHLQNIDSTSLDEVINSFNGLMDPDQRHQAEIHDEEFTSIGQCFEKYGHSFSATLYCIHIMTSLERAKRQAIDDGVYFGTSPPGYWTSTPKDSSPEEMESPNDWVFNSGEKQPPYEQDLGIYIAFDD